MVTVHTIRQLLEIASQDGDFFSIKIDAATSRDTYDLSNGIECHVHGNGNKTGDVREIAHPPPLLPF